MDNKMRELNSVDLILEMLKNKHYAQARQAILDHNAVDIAEILEDIMDEMGVETMVVLFRTLPKDISVDVFSYLPTDDQLALINAITDKELKFILDDLAFDDMIDVLEELPANLVDKILEKTPKNERRLINTFLNYPENSAGTLMTPDYISLRSDMSVRDALLHIKREGMDSETVYTCYVKDSGRKLIGVVSLRKLVISDDELKIADIMTEDLISINVFEDQERASEVFKRYGFLAIPVTDNEGRLVGIITVDDIFEVIEDEFTEDFERMSGILDASDKEYLDISVLHHYKNRLPWLVFLMISAMITGYIIRQFENVLETVIVLVAYMPLLMGTGGNTGAQAATLVIRGMATGELLLSDAWNVAWKEWRISLLLGVSLSAFNFAKIMIIDKQSFLIAFTVCITMIIIVMFAKVVGSMLPMLAKRVGIDPALMANPMISSMTDMFSVVTYFVLASLILNI